MNHANIMFETYDNDYNTMYRYYYGAVVNTYKMSTHTRFPDSELYNQPQEPMFLEPPRNAYIDILLSYKEQYSEDEWKVLSDAIAQEGQRLLDEEQESRLLWQEQELRILWQEPQEKLSLNIPEDDDDELTDNDECRELTDVDYIEENHEFNIYEMANLRCDDNGSCNMSIVSVNSQESKDTWKEWYNARLANGYYDSPGD
jgi:hypothetical protein